MTTASVEQPDDEPGLSGSETPLLTLIGYWAGPESSGGPWPEALTFVDSSWDADAREFIAFYLTTGLVVRLCMGQSPCRLCPRRNNGNLELTDGVYVWPEGLAHYVRDHDVRLPDVFVSHAYAHIETLEQARRNTEWWKTATPASWTL